MVKIIVSIEAFSEEFGRDDQKREILKTFVTELRRVMKNLEGLIEARDLRSLTLFCLIVQNILNL